MMTKKHCDDYIRDKTQPKCLRKFLLYNRIPATWQIKNWKWATPVLFATYNGIKMRVVMASRFGDVGITTNLKNAHGYDKRVAVEDLKDFTD